MNRPDDSTKAPPDPKRWRVLAVLLLIQFMLILDVSVVNVALPTIQLDLGFTRSGLAWVIDAYVLMAGGLLLLGGRLGDIYGRRRVFIIGVIVFGCASIVCGLAQNPGQLVGARFVQGIGEAMAAPAALGLIALLFTDRVERAKAIGYFGGVSGLGGTMGPILSGLLVEYATWRWIFLINVPIAILAVVAIRHLTRPVAGSQPRERVDLAGAALVTSGCLGIVYGAITAATESWTSAAVLVPLLGGAAALLAFAVHERSAMNPLVPKRFFTDGTRVAANLTTVFFYSVFFTQFFVTTLYLQGVLGFTPLQAGLAFLPFGIAVGAAIGIATSLLPKLGLRPVIVTGMAVTAVGTWLFARITPDGSYTTQVLPAIVVIALGSGLCLPALSNGAIFGVTEADAGVASGLQQAVQQIAGAIGLAVLITLAINRATDGVATGLDQATAVSDGYAFALRIGALLLALGTVAAAVLFRRGPAGGQVEAVEDVAEAT